MARCGTVRRLAWWAIGAIFLGACSESHTAGDGGGRADGGPVVDSGADAAVDGGGICPPIFEPISCMVRAAGRDCCEPAGEAECVGGRYVCTAPGAEEGRCGVDAPACGGGGCPEVPTPPCYAYDARAGCCDPADQTSMVCVDGRWRCPDGYRSEEACAADDPMPVPPLFDCTAFDTFETCVQNAECVPIFEDTCCPSCHPGPCADCFLAGYRFAACDMRVPVCEGVADPCGVLPSGFCGDDPPDCSTAVVVDDRWCSIPGCVAFIDVERCPDGACDASQCVPLDRESCGEALCDRIPPTCPDGWRPLVVDGCYGDRDRCIPNDVCSARPPGGGEPPRGGFCR